MCPLQPIQLLTKKEIIGIGTESANLENLDHIEELAMDVSYHGDGRSDMDHIALLHQQFLGFEAYCLDDRFGQQFFPVQAAIHSSRSILAASQQISTRIQR